MGEGAHVDSVHRCRVLLLLFGISLVVRTSLLIPVVAADVALQADENEYFSRANAFKVVMQDVADRQPLYVQDLLRAYGGGTFPPAHPLYLALSLLIDETTTSARWAVVLLSSLTTPLVYLLTLLCSTRRAAIAAAAIHTFYPSFLAFSHYLWSDTTYVFLILLAAYCTLCVLEAVEKRRRIKYALLSGCFLGLAALTRAAGLPIILLHPTWTYLSLRKRSGALSAASLMLVSSLVVLAPWELALSAREGRLVLLSSAAEYNLLLGNSPWESSERFEPDAKHHVSVAMAQYAEAHGVDESEAARALAIQEIKRAPLAFVDRSFHKLRLMWTVDRFIFRHILHVAYPPMAPATVVGLWLFAASCLIITVGAAAFGLIGAGSSMRHRGFFLTVLVCGMLPPLVTVADSRSSLPLLALLLPAAGHGVAQLRRPRRNGFATGLIVLVVASAALNVATIQAGRRASSKTSSYYWSLIRRVDRLAGSQTPFTDRIALRVEDPDISGGIEIRLLSDGYRFHATGTRRKFWLYSQDRPELTLNVYAHQPNEPLRMRLERRQLGQSVEIEPIRTDAWRRWQASGLRGVQYRWRGGGPPPPNRDP